MDAYWDLGATTALLLLPYCCGYICNEREAAIFGMQLLRILCRGILFFRMVMPMVRRPKCQTQSNTSSTSSTSSTSTGASQQEDPLSIRALSLALFGRFVLPFELLSVLFLSAMVGTIILVSKSDQ